VLFHRGVVEGSPRSGHVLLAGKAQADACARWVILSATPVALFQRGVVEGSPCSGAAPTPTNAHCHPERNPDGAFPTRCSRRISLRVQKMSLVLGPVPHNNANVSIKKIPNFFSFYDLVHS